MTLEVLISTMNQKSHELLSKMNIQSDAIVINQCDTNDFEEFEHKCHNVKFISFAERGVGLSRNNALMRAKSDICLMADDDMVYIDGYKEIVLNEFKDNPEADMIMFNVPIYKNDRRTNFNIEKNSRVRIYNALKYGTVHIGFRRESIIKANIFFSLLFGGGAKYGSGEDSLFIKDALSKGLRIYSSKKEIAEINETGSTWFSGYNDKFFLDKGVLFGCLSKRWSKLLCLQFVIRHYKKFQNEKTIREALRLMLEGAKEFK